MTSTSTTILLERHVASIKSEHLRASCARLIRNDSFLKAPASINFHHAYTGGLAEHTAEVTSIALEIAAGTAGYTNKAVDTDILTTAALWHDFGKVHTYRFDESLGSWQSSDGSFDRLIGHISGSVLAFMETEPAVCLETKTAIAHAMLAHHGPVREWGSPVAPQTLEALILHQADMLSAHHGRTA